MGEAELETVFDHFHARRRRDIDAVAAGLDARVVHQGVEPELVCDGRDEVVENVRRSFDRAPGGIEGIELLDAGEHVVVALRGAQFRENPLLNGELVMVFTVRDGLIVRIDDYRSREEAMQTVPEIRPS